MTTPMTTPITTKTIGWKGRGSASAPQTRFDALRREQVDDGWSVPTAHGIGDVETAAAPRTTVTEQHAKSIITRNQSPDIPFNQSINPYYGCEHGCSYCYARPSYAYWGMSPGIDFETRLIAKPNAAALLREALSRPGYRCEPISIGANTDPYQPIEREWKITRSILEVCSEFNQPVGIITKNALIERDIDLLAPMAARGIAKVFVSCATIDADLARKLEPRASTPLRRIAAIKALTAAGIPVGVMVAPMIPMVTDKDLEGALEAAREAGATEAGYVLIRLAHELKTLFREWLDLHMPDRAEHVMSLIRQSRGGRENDPRFGSRMRGEGVFADLIRMRFRKACARLGLNARHYQLDSLRFTVPELASKADAQLALF